ncbi:hypothetical protein FAIPA1_20296 [Frankia sp. AiPs1]
MTGRRDVVGISTRRRPGRVPGSGDIRELAGDRMGAGQSGYLRRESLGRRAGLRGCPPPKNSDMSGASP